MTPSDEKLKKLSAILSRGHTTIFEYNPAEDLLIFYDEHFLPANKIYDFETFFHSGCFIHPDDRSQIIDLYHGKCSGPIEIRTCHKNGRIFRSLLDISTIEGSGHFSSFIIGTLRDVTMERRRIDLLKAQAMRDSLTTLYNHTAGIQLINNYLSQKTPYASCALMIADIDYFKNVNDTYGHLFGDKVLAEFSRMLLSQFGNENILVRAGGDEFIVFLKDIGHKALLGQVSGLLDSVRAMTFPESDYSPTCSIGVCFLPENISGYTYDQLFENADWALYTAKKNGRNRYAFCDSLKRFELSGAAQVNTSDEIDARYFQNDVISCAFEIFEKTNSFDSALKMLMKIIGIRFQLDRITIIQTNTKACNCSSQYQWTAPDIPQVLSTPASFTKEDFLTLFHSYDEYGTTVLQHDNMDMYSPDAARLLIQGDAKTVVYSAMYCEGAYVGAISYVVCKNKRYWGKNQLSQLGELTKLISAHLAKNQALNASHQGVLSIPEYDRLTGLLSFSRFRDEVERIIVGNEHNTYAMVYSDLEDFKYFNQRYGYSMGDQLLKNFSNYIIETTPMDINAYFTRIVADQFALFMPYTDKGAAVEAVSKINNEFISRQKKLFPDTPLRIRSGIYIVKPGCPSASEALDAANYARKQVKEHHDCSVYYYDKNLAWKRHLENEIRNDMSEAMNQEQFKVYLQPKFSMKDSSIIGAEALVRWHLPDGTVLMPNSFVPMFEQSGRITELDFYVFEKVAAFLAKNNRLGRKQVPISINASILHAPNRDTVKHYLSILNRYQVDPSLTEIELTETATVSNYDSVRNLFQELQSVHILTSMDDFGSGYSILNTVIDIPVNTVKIDRLFIEKCTSSDRGLYFLEQIISMIKGLGYHVLCEGIETEEQFQLLKRIGCEYGQGYCFSRPLPIEDYEKLLYGATDTSE